MLNQIKTVFRIYHVQYLILWQFSFVPSKMYSYFIVLIALAITVNSHQETNSKLSEVFRWRLVDFQFPNDNIRNYLISSKRYLQANNSMLGLEVWRNRLFITVPRWYAGTGSTLNYVDLGESSRLELWYCSYDIFHSDQLLYKTSFCF